MYGGLTIIPDILLAAVYSPTATADPIPYKRPVKFARKQPEGSDVEVTARKARLIISRDQVSLTNRSYN
jgi:hypothetical protein